MADLLLSHILYITRQFNTRKYVINLIFDYDSSVISCKHTPKPPQDTGV